ncbi:hypothetical protein L1887_23746 [Cichorium endivia]|nr:hypothetical protein L1887_23746 [Cichorium endivia]
MRLGYFSNFLISLFLPSLSGLCASPSTVRPYCRRARPHPCLSLCTASASLPAAAPVKGFEFESSPCQP